MYSFLILTVEDGERHGYLNTCADSLGDLLDRLIDELHMTQRAWHFVIQDHRDSWRDYAVIEIEQDRFVLTFVRDEPDQKLIEQLQKRWTAMRKMVCGGWQHLAGGVFWAKP